MNTGTAARPRRGNHHPLGGRGGSRGGGAGVDARLFFNGSSI